MPLLRDVGMSSPSPRAPSSPKDQYLHLLTLLSQHGSHLPSATRAEHLKVAALLHSSLPLSPSAACLPHSLTSLSSLHAACADRKKGARAIDDEEPALLALLSLTAQACGCLPAGESYALARRPSETHASLAFAADAGGLFGAVEPPAPAGSQEGSALPASFASPAASAAAQRVLQTAAVDVHGAAALLIAAACDAAAVQRSVQVRAAALASLCAFVRALPVGLLAAFFPGIAASLLKMLAKCRVMQSPLVVLIVDALGVGVARLFPPRRAPQLTGDSPFASLVGELRSALPGEVPAPAKRVGESDRSNRASGLIVERDSDWYATASEKLCALIEAALAGGDGPERHPNQLVRTVLVPFVALVGLRGSLLAVPIALRWRCVFLLAEAAADDFDDVRLTAVTSLRNGAAAEIVEDAIRALVLHIGRLPPAKAIARGLAVAGESFGDDDGLHGAQDREMAAVLARIFPADDPSQRWTGALRGLLLAVCEERAAIALKRLDADALAVALVALQDATWTPSSLGSPDDYASVRSPALDICRSLGAVGLLPSLHPPLLALTERQRPPFNPHLEDGQSSDRVPSVTVVCHAHVCLCLQALTMGVVSETEPTLPRLELLRFVSATLAASAQVLLPDDLHDARPVRAKTMTLMVTAELCGGLQSCIFDDHCRSLDPAAALPVILPTLADAANDRPEIAAAAKHALETLAAATGARSTQRLVGRHANFIVARLVRALHTRQSALVLRYIVSSGSVMVSDRVVTLAEAALVRRCDDLAEASDAEAVSTLAALRAVLCAAPPPTESKAAPPRLDAKEKEWRDAARVLASFRAEYNPAEPNEIELSDEANGNRPFDDDDLTDAQRDAARTPFQRLAVRAASGACDLLVGRPALVRAAALRTALASVLALSDDRRALLPVTASLLPLLPPQLSTGATKWRDSQAVQRVNALGAELPVVAGACSLLAGLARTAEGFVRSRFVRAVFPELRALLRVLREPARPSVDAETASPAALGAADAALDAVAAVAEAVPEALAPFADELLETLMEYVRGGAPSAGEEARSRRKRARWLKRAKEAEKIVRVLAREEPDRTWASLVAIEGRQCVRHWDGGAGMGEMKVR